MECMTAETRIGHRPSGHYNSSANAVCNVCSCFDIKQAARDDVPGADAKPKEMVGVLVGQ